MIPQSMKTDESIDNPELVLPGQPISTTTYIPSHNSYVYGQNICSSTLGHPQIINKLILVRPIGCKLEYFSGQLVLGRVSKIMDARIRVSLDTCEGSLPIESLREKGKMDGNNSFTPKPLGILNTSGNQTDSNENQFKNSSNLNSKKSSFKNFCYQNSSSFQNTQLTNDGLLGNQSHTDVNKLGNKHLLNNNLLQNTSGSKSNLSENRNVKRDLLNTNLNSLLRNSFIPSIDQTGTLPLRIGSLILAQIQKTTGKTMTLTANAKYYGLLQEGLVLDVPYSYINHEMNNLINIGKRLFIRDNILCCSIPTNHLVYIHGNCAKGLIRYFRNCFWAKQQVNPEDIEQIINE